MKKEWWNKGLKFKCQGSGKCCVSRGEYGYVYLTLADRRRFARYFGISTLRFTKKYCEKTDDLFHLKEEAGNPNCRFLQGTKCGAYDARPTQCRTWPFWPELMNAKSWKKEVASYCPGVGKGQVWSKEKISEQMEIQSRADRSIGI